MAVQYRKLLSKRLRDKRWGDIIDAYQLQVERLDAEIVNRILLKEDIDFATDDELKLLFYEFGYDLPSFEGYTSTKNFIKKQVSVLIPQIVSKTTPKCYDYVFYVYNMIGAVYPLGYSEQEKEFKVMTDPEFRVGEQRIFQVMDQEQPYIDFEDGGIFYPDNPPVPSIYPLLRMDAEFSEDPNAQALYLDGIAKIEHTPHYAIRYFYRWLENATEFHSIGTAKSLYDSVKQLKRNTRVPHYQIDLDFRSSTDLFEHEYRAELDESITAKLEGIYIDSYRNTEIDYTHKIQFGIGGHASPLTDAITGCQSPVTTTVFSGNYYLTNFAVNVLDIQDIIKEYSKLTFGDNNFFSEVAILDSTDTCLFYAKFPKIRFAPEMYNSVRLIVNFSIHVPVVPVPDLDIVSIDGDATGGLGYGIVTDAQITTEENNDSIMVAYIE